MPQQDSILSGRRLTAALLSVLALHFLAWVLLPTFLEGSLRLDTAEHMIQGQEWQLANPKHPPFSTWLIAFAQTLGPARYLAIYGIGQTLALTGLLCASALLWREKNSSVAALAILIGLASPALTYFPIQINHNIGVMPFWGIALTAAYFAFERGRMGDWLLFAAAVGFGMWAKYSILHLAIPLAIGFMLVPAWRKQLTTAGPWVAGLLAVAIFAPQFFAVAKSGNDAFLHAMHSRGDELSIVRSMTNFVLTSAVYFLFMGVVASAAVGFRPLLTAVKDSFHNLRENRLQLYLHITLFGPLLFIVLAAPFGVRPRPLWITPIALSAALWWAAVAARAEIRMPRRALVFAGIFSLTLAVSYIARRLAPAMLSVAPIYADFDGPALERMANRYWHNHTIGPLHYVVSFGVQRGRQAAGSIAFDSAVPPHVFEEADSKISPWIDVSDVSRRGALVISTRPLTSSDRIAERQIEHIAEFERPTRLHLNKKQMIYMGILPPATVR